MSNTICQHCTQNPTAVQVDLLVNSTNVTIDLCEPCFFNLNNSIATGSIDSYIDLLESLLEQSVPMQEIENLDLAAMRVNGIEIITPSTNLSNILYDAMSIASVSAVGNQPIMCNTVHIMAAIMRSQEGMQILTSMGMNQTIRDQIMRKMNSMSINLGVPVGMIQAVTPAFNQESNILLPQAIRTAQESGANRVSVQHFIDCMLSFDSQAAGILIEAGFRITQQPGGSGNQGQRTGQAQTQTQETESERYVIDPNSILFQFGSDITKDAAEGKIDPVVGRENEIDATIETLARRRKNNVALIGEPGVGKTAIAEGLALRIVKDEVPQTLKNKTIFSLDLSSMVAGTQYRGMFEQRLKMVVEEIVKSEGQIILFIDELHTLVGAGSAEGSMDAANIIKPMLARGELNVIGATTLSEYRKSIEKDGALSRRFRAVYVDEPSVEETFQILQGLCSAYEEHHHVTISDEVLHTASFLADRYISEHYMPDKAIDLIDEAGARIRVNALDNNTEISELKQTLIEKEAAKTEAVTSEAYEEAQSLKEEIDQLEESIKTLEEAFISNNDNFVMTEEDVAAVISRKTGIPAGHMLSSDIEKLVHLEDELHKRVIGQNEAVELVADAVRHSRTGLADPSKPTASFLFLGPTGVGKTELAKSLAEQIFGSEDNLIRFDMSEYMEKHTVSRLVGSPPGYVGYDEAGQLTEAVRRRPYSIILLDEIEKAHPDVWNIFLQVMDDGRLTDGQGRTVDFRHTIIIMTSNMGAGVAAKRSIGFTTEENTETNTDRMLATVKAAMRPEFINRIDETIVFDALDETQSKEIVGLIVNDVKRRLLESQKATLEVSDDLLSHIASEGFDSAYGARPLRRYMRRSLERALDRAILSGEIKENSVVKADFNGELVLTVETPSNEEEVVSSEEE